MPSIYVVCRVEDLPPGERTIVELGGTSIGVFNLNGDFYIVNNVCPHQFAPLCEGQVTGMTTSEGPGTYQWTRDGEVIQCPWHGWKFDIETGESTFNPHRSRIPTYETDVEEIPTQPEDAPGESGPIEVDHVDTDPTDTDEGMVVVYA